MTEELEKIIKRLDDRLDTFKKELLDGQDRVATAAAWSPSMSSRKNHMRSSRRLMTRSMKPCVRRRQSCRPGGSSTVPSAENIKAVLDALKQGRAMVAEQCEISPVPRPHPLANVKVGLVTLVDFLGIFKGQLS